MGLFHWAVVHKMQPLAHLHTLEWYHDVCCIFFIPLGKNTEIPGYWGAAVRPGFQQPVE